jgi:hypothetical protein
MVDYYPLPKNHKQPQIELEGGEEHEVADPIVVDLVYNTYEERNGKTIAVTLSLRLPNVSRCPHCEAAGQFPNRARTHHRKEA